MAEFFINGRFINQKVSGVQRYGHSVLKGLQSEDMEILRPQVAGIFAGIRWEQFGLPLQLKALGNPLLVNLCNTAPQGYANQIVTIHDLATIDHPEWFSRSFSVYYQWLLPRITQGARHVVTVSEWSKRRLVDRFQLDPTDISVIPPQVSTSLMEATPEPVEVTRPFILMVGTMDRRKWFPQAIDALLPLAKSQGMSIVWVGRRSRHFSEVKLQKDPAITTCFDLPDGQLKWLYEHCNLFIQPSVYEGYSLTPHEALAFGANVLVSDLEVHRSALGERAHYFAKGNPSALVLAAREAILQGPPSGTTTTEQAPTSASEAWNTLIHSLLHSSAIPTFRP